MKRNSACFREVGISHSKKRTSSPARQQKFSLWRHIVMRWQRQSYKQSLLLERIGAAVVGNVWWPKTPAN